MNPLLSPSPLEDAWGALDLEARRSPVIVLEQALAQRGSVPASKIRVAEIHVDKEAPG